MERPWPGIYLSVAREELVLVRPSAWHLITSEYPPQPGGVSDYTATLASGLSAAGNLVHVWCPSTQAATEMISDVVLHPELGRLRPTDLRRAGCLLNKCPAPRRLLVQWVPHGYGYRSMNVAFAAWIWGRAQLHGDTVELMVHEPFLAFSTSYRQNLAAVIQRLMLMVLLSAARGVWVAIPAWERLCRPYTLRRRVEFRWLPLPSNIPFIDDQHAIAAIRARYGLREAVLLGHFGTYDSLRTEMLMAIIPEILRNNPEHPILLLGRGNEAMRKRLVDAHPALKSRLHAPGMLEPYDLSSHISACDVMIQPFPDGVSTRRTSIMAALSHGRPVVTTKGHLTESLWGESGAVALAPAAEVSAIAEMTRKLIVNRRERQMLGEKAKALYSRWFDVSLTVGTLINDR
jgi:glycosyltransferase involved in cell wall biosynthesis